MTPSTKKPESGSRRIARLSIVAAVVLSCFSLAAAGPLTIPGGAAPAFPPPPSARESGFPVGSYQAANGSLVVIFSSDGKFSVKSSDGGPIAAGAYTIDGDQILFSENLDGEDGNRMCEDSGKYRWKFDGKALVFSKVEDECEGRVRALTSGPCPKLKDRDK